MLRTAAMPPSPRPTNFRERLVGPISAFGQDPLGVGRRLASECGPIYTLMNGPRRIAIVSDPEVVQYVLVERHRQYHKSIGYEVLRPMLGNGLLTSEGDFWRKQRRLLQPAFHKSALASFATIMQEEGEAAESRLLEAASRGETVDITAEMNRVTMAIVARCLLGSMVPGDMDAISRSLETANREANHRLMHPLAWPMWLPTPRNRKGKAAIDTLQSTVQRFIEAARQAPPGQENLLAMLLGLEDADTGETMSDKQLQDEVTTIFVAGHETTANAMAWALYALSNNPEADAKLREAVHSENPCTPDPQGSPMVRAVARETLRMYPPAWIIGRKSLEDDTLGGHAIARGTNVLLFTLGIQRDARWWPEPDRFLPERHLGDAAAGLPKYAYFPFGGGPRICIGLNMAWMEMHVLLPLLTRRLRFRPTQAEMGLDALITLHPKQRIRLKPERVA